MPLAESIKNNNDRPKTAEKIMNPGTSELLDHFKTLQGDLVERAHIFSEFREATLRLLRAEAEHMAENVNEVMSTLERS